MRKLVPGLPGLLLLLLMLISENPRCFSLLAMGSRDKGTMFRVPSSSFPRGSSKPNPKDLNPKNPDAEAFIMRRIGFRVWG